MKRLSAVVTSAVAAILSLGPASAAGQFVQDGAGLLAASTVQQLETRLDNFNAQTGKSVVVITVPALPAGQTIANAAQSAFTQQQVNGTLIYVARDNRQDYVLPDRSAGQAGWFSGSTSSAIAQSMNAEFKNGNYDAGITSGVNGVLDIYRSHLSSVQRSGTSSGYAAPSRTQTATSVGGHISMFWWIVIAVIAYLIIRSIMRAGAARRYYGSGAPPTAPGAGYGPGPGYGGGYGMGGYGMGGGGFWSGLLGGLGGAFLGNELFRGGGSGGWGGGGGVADASQQLPPGDAGGWQSDAGQSDPSGGGGGDFGGGGFGDFGGGGGGGGDFGGGGDGGGGGSW
ncbi:MAG: TPM domain-containing protein [Candidatus Eremiobacteraeota bacterium]|nr:TPM domain-containing protein [Candidatus Eremiobacteraeota bacterium]